MKKINRLKKIHLSRNHKIIVLCVGILLTAVFTYLGFKSFQADAGVAVGGAREIRPGEYNTFGATHYTIEKAPIFWLTLDTWDTVPQIKKTTLIMPTYGKYYRNYYARQDETSLVLCPKVFDDYIEDKFPAIKSGCSSTKKYFNYTYGMIGSTSTIASKKETDLKRIIRLGESDSDSKPSFFEKGIFYDRIYKYLKEQIKIEEIEEDVLQKDGSYITRKIRTTNYEELAKALSENGRWIKAFKVDIDKDKDNCYRLWSYITKITDDKVDIVPKINEYTKSGQIDWSTETIQSINERVKKEIKENPDNAEAYIDQGGFSEYCGYIDLLITLYVLSDGSGAQNYWKQAVQGYMVWATAATEDDAQNKFNISITAGGGYMINETGEPEIYMINPVQAVMASMGIGTANDFSANKRTADKIAEQAKSNDFYDMLLVAYQNSLKASPQQTRIYRQDVYFGSRLINILLSKIPTSDGSGWLDRSDDANLMDTLYYSY